MDGDHFAGRPAPADGGGRSGAAEDFATWFASHEVEIRDLSLDAIVGLPAAKRELESLIVRLRNPEVFLAMGADLPRGIVAHGPPGCGKTLIARVLAGMLAAPSRGNVLGVSGAEGIQAEGRGVRFLEFSASELSPEKLIAWQRQSIVDDSGRYTVVFIDEIDLIGKNRDNFLHSEATRASLFALLSVLDGLRPHDRVVFVAATNSDPDDLDPALVRAGRLGISVAVSLPDFAERKGLFEHYLVGRRLAETIDVQEAAELAGPNTTPADVRQMLDDGAALAMADGKPGMTQASLNEAIQRRGKVAEVKRVPTAVSRRIVAAHESGHALVGVLVGRPPTSINTEKRDGTAVTVWEDIGESGFLLTSGEILDFIAIGLAGLEAEKLLLGETETSLGSWQDLQSATTYALRRLDAGLDPGFPALDRDRFGTDHGQKSDRMADEAYAAISATMGTQRARAERLLTEHRDQLERLMEIVLEERVLGGDRLPEVFRELGLEPSPDAPAGQTDEAPKEAVHG